jgi:hypothetical protein
MEIKLTVNMPEWALSYMINGDASGLVEGEREMIDGWYTAQRDESGHEIILNPDGEHYFSNHPAFGLPCVCVECDVISMH